MYGIVQLALAYIGVPGNGKFALDSKCLAGVEGHEDKTGIEYMAISFSMNTPLVIDE